MKTLAMALTLLAGILLSSSGLLVTHAYTGTSSTPNYGSSQQPQLVLGLQGAIVSAGNQVWRTSGGSLAGAQLGTETVLPGGSLSYSLTASVSQLTASGTFSLSLSGQTADGQRISVNAVGPIVGYVPMMCFPNYDMPGASGTCASGDTSAIPAYFEAGVQLTETLGSTTTTAQQVLLIESPIMNPWGAPIVIASTDGTVNVVATYTSATATWANVQMSGPVSGTYNGNAATGTFTLTTTFAFENFVTGNEVEIGSVSLQGMTPSTLNVKGWYMGTSTVPQAGSYDCSALVGQPTGTCTATGLTSTGTFAMNGNGISLQGSYAMTWPAPSIYCAGTLTATVNQNGGWSNWNN